MYIFNRPVVNSKSCSFERFPCDLIQLQNRAISPEKSFEKREISVGRNKKVKGYWYPPPPHPPKPTSTLTRHLGQIVGLREGLVGSFLETYNDSNLLSPNVLVKSRILGFGIGNTAQGIRNPSIYWIPESKFH